MCGCTRPGLPSLFHLHTFSTRPLAADGAVENAEHKVFSARFSAARHCFPKTRGQKHILFLHGRTCAAQTHHPRAHARKPSWVPDARSAPSSNVQKAAVWVSKLDPHGSERPGSETPAEAKVPMRLRRSSVKNCFCTLWLLPSAEPFCVCGFSNSSALMRSRKNTLRFPDLLTYGGYFSVANFMGPFCRLGIFSRRESVVCWCQVAWKTMRCDTRHIISQRFALRNIILFVCAASSMHLICGSGRHNGILSESSRTVSLWHHLATWDWHLFLCATTRARTLVCEISKQSEFSSNKKMSWIECLAVSERYMINNEMLHF